MVDDASKTGTADQRAHKRIEVSVPILVRGQDVMGAAFEESAHSYNVSREGASFLVHHEVEVGQRLELILIKRGPGGRDFETLGEVRRVIPKQPGEWEVGVHIVGPRLRMYLPETL